ncbi:hypothetical protein ABZW96_13610 [Nocardia sp. NPDC004168]
MTEQQVTGQIEQVMSGLKGLSQVAAIVDPYNCGLGLAERRPITLSSSSK